MKQAAAEQRFERAAAIRDQLQAIRDVTEQQHVAGVDADAPRLHRPLCRRRLAPVSGAAVPGRQPGGTRALSTCRTPARSPAKRRPAHGSCWATTAAGVRRWRGLTVYIRTVEEPEALTAALRTLLPSDTGRQRAAPRVHVPRRGKHAQVLRLADANARQDAERANPGVEPRARRRGVGSGAGSPGRAAEDRRIRHLASRRGATPWRRWWCSRPGSRRRASTAISGSGRWAAGSTTSKRCVRWSRAAMPVCSTIACLAPIWCWWTAAPAR